MRIEPHPLLAVAAFTTHFASALEELGTPPYITVLLNANADVPVERNENIRQKVRDVLRHGGYKPTGRGKPASEYLAGATAERRLSNINLAVDICNAVSLHSGLPISVVDSAKLRGPVRVAVATPQSEYVFNASGQTIDLSGLLCLFDGHGPIANAVKDSQRTKTSATTCDTLSVLWCHRELAAHLEATLQWYQQLLTRCGARIENVAIG
jgi:DNA/RNA-binding domain of Phe-tRNA-synthetase-like protein